MHPKSPNYIDLLKMTIPIFLNLIIIMPSASPSTLSFNFNNFSSDDHRITYERAYALNNVIQLTESSSQVGRATYTEPMQLWDKASGNLADFTTHFSFIIDSQNRTAYGDGLAFFLAPAGSRIPPGAGGGTIGLTSGNQELTDRPFVAVEFDIYRNDWDPKHDHVGIDINSMRSVSNITWWSSILGGKQNDAWVNYDSSTKNLSATFTGFINNTLVQQVVYYIVDLRDYLPELVTFGFSAATGDDYAKQSILSWSFNSTLQIKRKTKWGVILGPILGGMVGIAFLVWVSFAIRHRRMTRASERRERGENRRGTGVGENRPVTNLPSGCGRIERNQDNTDYYANMDEEFERSRGPRKFSYEELASATNNFAGEKLLGRGGFGAVYEGCLEERPVAVKKIPGDSRQHIKGYASEVRVISQLRHRNLVQLIGWCREERELMLVYDFMPNRSLDFHLFYLDTFLEWETRYKIAQGLAAALRYLHEECERCVVHRDIKSSNVMLDSDFNAKLGDFGLARIVTHGQEVQTSVIGGTPGYMAPECNCTHINNKKTDVYSFGVVALEIACGRRAIFNHHAEPNPINLVTWVRRLHGTGRILEAVDQRLGTRFNRQQMERLMVVGLSCANTDCHRRPSIGQALRVLNFEAELAELPPTISTTSSVYATPPESSSVQS